MNQQEKKWIKENLYKIFILDADNDSQTEDTMNFLADLAVKVGFDLSEVINE